MWRTIHQITPTLFLSSGTAVSNKQEVLDKKIKLIINATIDLPNRTWNNQIDVVFIFTFSFLWYNLIVCDWLCVQ